MGRILLASSNLVQDPYPVYPLGMAIVAGALEARGHQVEQFDFLAAGGSEAAFRERLGRFQPDIVGLSLRNLDSCDSLARTDFPGAARQLTGAVRQACGAKVILGGPAFSLLPEELLAFTGADHGVAGEGEALAPILVETLLAGRPAPPVLRQEGVLAASAFAAPSHDPEVVRFYLDQAGMLNVQSKRGCPHRCAYCDYPALEGGAWRHRDPEAVVAELARAQAEFGCREVFFVDSVFNDAQGRYLALAEAILRRGLELRWNCYMRPARLGLDELRLLKRAGLRAVELGTDASSDATLRGLAKGFGFEEVVASNQALVQCGIPCAHFVMFGGPEETWETVETGLANLDRLQDTVVFAYSGIRILPGTPLHARAIAEGLLEAGTPLREPRYYHAPGLLPERLNQRLEAAFRGRRDRFFPPESALERMAVMRRMGLRGLGWDTLIRPAAARRGR